jgi:UDP-N-acetylmuramoyl-tripeptide--D-alanyl-D-alanine ligase
MRGVTLWTSSEIADATEGQASEPFSVTGVAFDSREVGSGDLFIALSGENTDGHRFVDQAFAAGAAGAITARRVDHPHVLVADTTTALVALGAASRARTQGKVIGVTGSVGKTGTKEALFHALDRSAPGRVHRSLKSYNNHVGVPLSLSRMPRDTRFGIFEMGMNHAGELTDLTRIVRPDVAIVTAIAPAHKAFFPTIEAIADAKAEIFAGLEPGGTAIIPHDSPYAGRLRAVAERYAARILTFGLGEGADVRAVDMVPTASGGTLVTVNMPEAEICLTVGPPGEHWVSNALAVLAAVESVGGDLAAAGLALAELPGLAGRGARMSVAAGAGEAVVIDESYNANPLSMEATLKQLGREQGERRLVVLGAMKELGEESEAFHAALAGPIEAAKVDFAILVGPEMASLAQRLEGRIGLAHVADADMAAQRLKSELRAGDVVLVKGSNSVGLSRVVAAMTDDKKER